MNKLLVALVASAFAFVLASALAADGVMKRLSEMSEQEAYVAGLAAKERWARMTFDERFRANRDAQTKKAVDWTAMDEYAIRHFPNGSVKEAQQLDKELSTKRKTPLAPAEPR